MLMFSFILISLFTGLIFSYEWLAIKLANQYLSEYDTQITTMSIRPRSLTRWQIPKLTLQIKGSDIRIQDLEFTLNNDVSLLHFSAEQVADITLGSADVALNPNVLTDEGHNVDKQGPTLALDIAQLPQITIGKTLLSLKGTPSNSLNLTVEHLTLNKLGQLAGQLTQQGETLFTLDAQFTDKKWTISSSIVLKQLQQLIKNIAKQDLAKSQLSSIQIMKKKLDRWGIDLSGTLNSKAELDLKTAQLVSVHELIQTQLTLSQFAGLSLIPNTPLAQSASLIPTGLLTHIQNKPNQILKFEIGGHLTDLSLTLLPFSIILTPKPEQQVALLTLTKNKTLLKIIELLQTKENKTNEFFNELTATISLREPLNVTFSAQQISVPNIELAVVNNTISTIASLTALSLVLPHGQQFLTLNSDWSLNLMTKKKLALQSLLPQKLNTLELNLANTSIVAKGELQLKLVDNTHDGVTETESIFTLSVDSEAHIVSDELTLHTGRDKQTSMTMKVGSLSLSGLTSLQARYSSDSLSVVLPSFILTLGPIKYSHYLPTSRSKDIEFNANRLRFRTLAPSDFNAKINAAEHLPLSLKNIQFTGSRFSLDAENIKFSDKPMQNVKRTTRK